MDKKLQILVEEVWTAIKLLKSSQILGTNNVAGEMIKYSSKKLKKEMRSLCNHVWEEGMTLEEWKKSSVLIHKTGIIIIIIMIIIT